MGKKRIFELAKELGYQNRDLIDQLQKLGFEVKSHSSTVDEDAVREALKKAEEDRKAKTDERRVSRTVIRRRSKDGGEAVVRRRKGDDGETVTVVRRRSPESEAESEAAAPPAPVQEAPPPPKPEVRVARPARTARPARPLEPEAKVEKLAETEVRAEAAAPSESAPVEAQAPAAEAPPETPPVAEAPETQPSVEPVEMQAPDEGLPVPAQTEVEVAPPAAETKTVAEPIEKAEEVSARSDPATTASSPDDDDRREDRLDRRREDYEDDDEKPDIGDLAFEEFDFGEREDDDERQRVAPPPPSSPAVSAKKQVEPETKVLRRIDPSILKARLKQSKRPEPPKDWGKTEQAPQPASPVTELVVRTDASGKRKELVDVRKENAKNKRSPGRRREEMSAKDLLEHRRGQVYYPAPNRKRPKTKRSKQKTEPTTPVAKQPIQIGDTITAAELSQQMGVKATQIISWLMRQGVMAGINQPIDHDTAALVCEEMGYEIVSKVFDESEHLAAGDETETVDENATPRAPVVTVMGHVDHGKTSLLDYIRKANVAAGEAGGITQRIAGYKVGTSMGDVTFLDTPGHAAFSQMRARGANITDIIILVVAADDGVMPQTKEAIEHAKSADVPLLVAVNKIDKPEANPDRVLQQLADHGILVEEWGGDVLMRKISAKTGAGVDDLLEQLALQSEIMELKANEEVPAVGAVVEGHVHKGRGPVATVLVKEGTLRKGDLVVAGECQGKVRAMITDGGKQAKAAGPSTPVEILGLDGVPSPGDELRVASSLAAAKELVAHRREKRRAAELTGSSKVSLQDIFAQAEGEEQKELRIIIKADVQGSVEALKDSLQALTTQKVKVSVISGGVGAVVESDVEFAVASEAIIIGFGVRPDTKALKAARSSGVDIRTYSIIYEAVDEVKLAMQGLLSPVEKEKYLGRAEVRQTFNVPKVGTIAGCAVVDGIINRNANVRLLRDSRPIYDGKLSSLKRFKDDVREVREGFECGMGIERFNDVKEGDIIEAYEVVMTEAALDEPIGSDEARP
ncbi:MAG: translation initiation factor IF-2 [Myxococcota bacterium]